MKLIFTHRFRDELRREYQFLRERNPPAAERVREKILATIQRLKQFPQSGRSWRLPGTWELVVPGLPYTVIYEIDDSRVVVLTLFHTSREFPPRLN